MLLLLWDSYVKNLEVVALETTRVIYPKCRVFTGAILLLLAAGALLWSWIAWVVLVALVAAAAAFEWFAARLEIKIVGQKIKQKRIVERNLLLAWNAQGGMLLCGALGIGLFVMVPNWQWWVGFMTLSTVAATLPIMLYGAGRRGWRWVRLSGADFRRAQIIGGVVGLSIAALLAITLHTHRPSSFPLILGLIVAVVATVLVPVWHALLDDITGEWFRRNIPDDLAILGACGRLISYIDCLAITYASCGAIVAIYYAVS